MPADTPRADHEFYECFHGGIGLCTRGNQSHLCHYVRGDGSDCGLPRSAHLRPEPAAGILGSPQIADTGRAKPAELEPEPLERLVAFFEEHLSKYPPDEQERMVAAALAVPVTPRRAAASASGFDSPEPAAGDPLGEIREALESAWAGVWDAHYGKGIAVEYARSVDRKIRAALDSLARYGLKEEWK